MPYTPCVQHLDIYFVYVEFSGIRQAGFKATFRYFFLVILLNVELAR